MEQNGQKQFQCTGNCLNCLPAQRGYCASQHAYSNMKVLDALMGMIIGMQTSIKLIEEKIDSMRGSEESVFDPNAGNDTIPLQQGTEITQDGDGVIE